LIFLLNLQVFISIVILNQHCHSEAGFIGEESAFDFSYPCHCHRRCDEVPTKKKSRFLTAKAVRNDKDVFGFEAINGK